MSKSKHDAKPATRHRSKFKKGSLVKPHTWALPASATGRVVDSLRLEGGALVYLVKWDWMDEPVLWTGRALKLVP